VLSVCRYILDNINNLNSKIDCLVPYFQILIQAVSKPLDESILAVFVKPPRPEGLGFPVRMINIFR